MESNVGREEFARLYRSIRRRVQGVDGRVTDLNLPSTGQWFFEVLFEGVHGKCVCAIWPGLVELHAVDPSGIPLMIEEVGYGNELQLYGHLERVRELIR